MSSSSSWSARLIVLVQVVCAVCVIIGTYRHVESWKVKFEDAETIEKRIIHTFRYLALSLIPLVLSVGIVANGRYFSKAIDPLSGNDELILTGQRILANTLEQFVLHSFTLLAYSTFLDTASFKFIPMLCALFLLGRLLFMAGYYVNPLIRGFGFGLTFYPTVFTLASVVSKLINSSFFDWISDH